MVNCISKIDNGYDSLCEKGWVDAQRSREDQRAVASCTACIVCYEAEQNSRADTTVGEVIDGRVGVYGDPKETFIRIAQVWTGILGHHVNPTDVPLLLLGMKAVRTQVTPDYSDNSDDIDGYLDIFRTLVGEDMVKARTVSEYLELKGQA